MKRFLISTTQIIFLGLAVATPFAVYIFKTATKTI